MIHGSRTPLEAYRRRVVAIALLNTGVIAAVAVLHGAFISVLGPPRPALIACLVLLFGGQFGLLAWSGRLAAPPPERTDRAVAAASIAFTLVGVGLALRFGEGDEHLDFLLLLPAVVLAAFRFGWGGTLLTVGAASALILADVRSWLARHPGEGLVELDESATVCVMFLALGVVVHVLADGLRRRGEELAGALAQLSRAQDRLVESERLDAVGRLSTAIAHEFREPVAMIHGALAAAARGGVGAAGRERLLEVATQEAERLERLTVDFLTYARAREPHRREAAAAETLADVAAVVHPRAAGAGLRVHVAAGEERGAFDPFMVHLAMLHLALNAVAATAPGGSLTLGAVRADGVLVLWVENTGDAIPDDVARRAFEPFFTTRPDATGLGLAIARGVARAHGGDAMLARNEPRAVRFQLTLPDA